MKPRLDALDALRGVLALVVATAHVLIMEGLRFPGYPAKAAVSIFFVMSGYVLARAWDGRISSFLIRRYLRLWPVYGVCLSIGALLVQHSPTWDEWLLWPSAMRQGLPELVDPPTWSLFAEVAMTPILPLMFLINRSRGSGFALVLACLALSAIDDWGRIAACFAIGVNLTHVNLRWTWHAPRPLLWLGKVSYSLYLSHWIVMALCVQYAPRGAAGAATLAAMLPVAWAVWRLVEHPSIVLSRRAGRILLVRGVAHG